jgi:hypothetical protein
MSDRDRASDYWKFTTLAVAGVACLLMLVVLTAEFL